MSENRYNFNHLSAHELLPYLVYELDNVVDCPEKQAWQVCWLNNNGHPIIGLLPKITWTVWPSDKNKSAVPDNPLNIRVRTATRNHVATKTCPSSNLMSSNDLNDILFDHIIFKPSESIVSYVEWVNILIEYANQYTSTLHKPVPETNAHPDANAKLNSESKAKTSTEEDPTLDDPSHQHNYHNGLVGFIGYDVAASHISPHAHIKWSKQPAAYLGHYDIYLSKNDKQEWQLHWQKETPPKIIALVDQCLSQIDANMKRLKDSNLNNSDLNDTGLNDKKVNQNETKQPHSTHTDFETSIQPSIKSTPRTTLSSYSKLTPYLKLTPCWHKTHYQSAFKKVQDYLYQGDSYQINLTQKWQGTLTQHFNSHEHSKPITLLEYLPHLQQNTQAPFAGYLRVTATPKQLMLDGENTAPVFELLSCSPELFLVFDKDEAGNHRILTKPIKGTRPRGSTPQTDCQLKDELKNSEKDKAENVMIVDLLRNDLGKYAKTGSVQVPKLFAIESFSNVHHMVSTVTATIKKEVHPLTVLFDSLPAGSITGAPKKRAVEIINELEVDSRGAYCGTMGFMNFDGTGQWNVLIRTLQATCDKNQLKVNLWAGGGITVGSKCDAEYQECFDKVGNLLDILLLFKQRGNTSQDPR